MGKVLSGLCIGYLGALIVAILATTVRQGLVAASWVLMAPGFIITVSGSIHGYFLGRKRNLLIAIGLLISIITDLLWDIGGLPIWTPLVKLSQV